MVYLLFRVAEGMPDSQAIGWNDLLAALSGMEVVRQVVAADAAGIFECRRQPVCRS